jgi:plasmid stabilization system protein ParE
MPTCTFSPAAEADFDDIFRYIARESQSISTAVSHEKKLTDRCETLAHYPMSGVSCAEMGIELSRRVIYQNYIIYYRPVHDGVYVTRIVHSRMNQRKILGI